MTARQIIWWVIIVGVPVVVAILLYRGLVPTYTPPLQVFTQHPSPPERIWDFEVPSWVLEWRSEDIEIGRVIYEANCAPCHGKELDGKGIAAQALSYPVSPVAFKEKGFIDTLTLPYTFWRVREGGIQDPTFFSAMVPWGRGIYEDAETLHTADLTEDEIWHVIQYIYRASGMKPAEFGELKVKEVDHAQIPHPVLKTKDVKITVVGALE